MRRLTEDEWAVSSDSFTMLFARRLCINTHPRKARLFAVACCERIGHLLSDKRSHTAIKAAARYADGWANERQLLAAAKAAADAHHEAFQRKGKIGASAEWAAQFVAHNPPFFAATRASNFAFVAAGDGLEAGPEHAAQAHLLRDIFGNPSRPVTMNPAWQTPSVVSFAQTIYDERAFDRLPELADALVAAGCDNQEIVNHCRSDGPHVRGCWAVDLVLGRE